MPIDKAFNRARDAARKAAIRYEILVAELIPEDRRIEFIQALDEMILTRDEVIRTSP